MKRVDLAACALLVLGVVGMVFAARSAQPLVVTVEDCLALWNNTPVHPVDLPANVDLHILGEGEQDLGYGLCSLLWADPDGQCQTVSTPVWKDTDAWDTRASLHRCDDATLGGAVTPLADGRLRLED